MVAILRLRRLRPSALRIRISIERRRRIKGTRSWTGPVPIWDPLPVPILDGARPDLGRGVVPIWDGGLNCGNTERVGCLIRVTVVVARTLHRQKQRKVDPEPGGLARPIGP